MGFYLHGFYWQPLDVCTLKRAGEVRRFVQQAKEDKLRRIPPLNQYSVILAEFGVSGLLIFCIGCIAFLWQSICFSVQNKDPYVYSMACTFLGMLGALSSVGMMNALIFPLFSGYLYAISKKNIDNKSLGN